jgi:transposase
MKAVKESKETAAKPAEIRPRRKYDAVFKREAVALWLNSGKSAREISGELGVTQHHLYDWKKTYGPVSPGSEAQRETELASLRRENALLRQQRDILKKTLGIVFEAPNSGSNGSTP